jgi:hypothetical protein
MRWDIRHPEKRFGDRFVLVGGHTIPLVYCTLAVLNEAMRVKYQQTGDKRYYISKPEERMLTWEDLLKFRRHGGLAGHAEMEGKTLFLKFNTGPRDTAARRRRDKIRDKPGDALQGLLAPDVPGDGAKESLRVRVQRRLENSGDLGHLDDRSRVHHGDPAAAAADDREEQYLCRLLCVGARTSL